MQENTMRRRWGAAVIALAAAVALGACGDDESDAAHAGDVTLDLPENEAPSNAADVRPSDDNQHATIADYLNQSRIRQEAIARDAPGAPEIRLALPAGWLNATEDAPGDAIALAAYQGTEEGYASITGNLYRLTGDVDTDVLLGVAGGDAKNLPDFDELGSARDEFAGFPSYRIAGTYDESGSTVVIFQRITVIEGTDGNVYVLELLGDSNEGLAAELGGATEQVDAGSVVTP